MTMLLDLAYLAPLLILSVTVVFVLMAIAFGRSHGGALLITLVGLAGAFAYSTRLLMFLPRRVGILLYMDTFAYFYMAAFCAVAFVVAILAYDYFRRSHRAPEEFYVLLLLATIGCATLAASTHFAALFLGLEILSVSLYAMIAYTSARERSLEAGIKYLVLAAVSSAFLVFGIALIYAQVGTLDFSALGLAGLSALNWLGLAGGGMLLVGAGFKLAVVPFHFWTPDVYEGSPAPATAFIATASKGAMVAVLLRLFHEAAVPLPQELVLSLAAIAIASMLAGNLLALMQTNVKRILAYSSIAHLGYVLVAFVTVPVMAVSAATYYIVAYMATGLGAFGVLSVLSDPEGEAEDLSEYHGLAWRRPGLAAVMTCMLLSLAGIPLTAGFIGKFYVVAAGAQSAIWLTLGVLAISSVIGLFYYLRIILVMFASPHEAPGHVRESAASPPGRAATSGAVLALGAILVLVIWLGVHPTPVFLVLQEMFRPPF